MVELAQIVCWYNGFTTDTFFPILASEPYLRPFFIDLKTYSFPFSFLLISVYSQKCLNSLYFSLTFFFFPLYLQFLQQARKWQNSPDFFLLFLEKKSHEVTHTTNPTSCSSLHGKIAVFSLSYSPHTTYFSTLNLSLWKLENSQRWCYLMKWRYLFSCERDCILSDFLYTYRVFLLLIFSLPTCCCTGTIPYSVFN